VEKPPTGNLPHAGDASPPSDTHHRRPKTSVILTGSRKWVQTRRVPTTLEAEDLLRGAALRVTRPRVAVLTAVYEHPHADTDTIIGAVRTSLSEVSHQAVYDVLRALTAAGLVRRIEPSGSVARYESRVADNHHHVVCRSCGAIADVDCAVGDTPCLTASHDHGYSIDEAEVTYWGVCPACANADANEDATDDTAPSHPRAMSQKDPRA